MTYVLIKPDQNADVVFFKGVEDDYSMSMMASSPQRAVTTELLSDAHVFEYSENEMQYVLDKMACLAAFSAVPIAEIDMFKAKLAGT